MDWEQFEFAYRLEIKDPALLIRIEAYRGTAYNLMLPPDWRDQLDRLNRVRAVHGTTALEGNPLSEEQVAESLDGNDADGVGRGSRLRSETLATPRTGSGSDSKAAGRR